MQIPKNPLFRGIDDAEYADMAARGCIRFARCEKGRSIFRAGDAAREFGIVLSGEVHVESFDLWGNRMILHSIGEGQMFAESFALCRAPMAMDVSAARDSELMFVDAAALLGEGVRARSWYLKMLLNLLGLTAGKNLAWSGRMSCISQKTIRARVMSYLSSEARAAGKSEFAIPFDRQQLADYLNVERSALSKELGRMRADRLIDFHKNRFRLLAPPRG